MEITGKVLSILAPVSGVSSRSGEPWVKNSFVLETQGDYPKKCVFTVFGADRWHQMGIAVGGSYAVSFDIDAHEYNGKWFNDVSAWKAVRLDVANAGVAQGGSGGGAPKSQAAAAPVQAAVPAAAAQEAENELPF